MRTSAEAHEVKTARKALAVGMTLSIVVTLLLAVSSPILVAQASIVLGIVAGILAFAGAVVATVLVDKVLTAAPAPSSALGLAA